LETGTPVSAHLLVPGWTYTGLTNAPDGKQPVGTWTADQVVEQMIGAVEGGDFYVICPDGMVTPELDAARIRWSAEDMTENRPALSRWNPAWKDRFKAFVGLTVGQD
ncbi:short-chain dehydrogenase, partial [Cupriavidus sp. 2MCAB6]